jgi:glutamyl-tRNA synthetase
VVEDAIRGTIAFASATLDDFVLVRSDSTPTYNFASVVDDALMEITHVIRGDDHLSNTPRQILVFEALGHDVPIFAHLPMIWGADGKRLSKRHGATSVEAYRDEGYLPAAILNYLALLGWSLDGETTIISADTLATSFSLDRVSANPAIFDVEKLDWMNGVYIREMTPEAFADVMTPWLVDAGLLTVETARSERRHLTMLAPLVAERVKRLDEIAPMVAFLFVDAVKIDPTVGVKVLGAGDARRAIEAAVEALAALPDFTAAEIEAALRTLPEKLGMKPKQVFQAVRVAVTGSSVSLPLFESLELLGRDRALDRLSGVPSFEVDDPAAHP